MRTPIDNLQIASDKLRPYAASLYPLYVWLIAAPLMLIATIALGIACLTTVHFIGPRRAGRWYAASWSRLGLLLLGIRVDIRGLEHLKPNRSAVIVANHLSQIDIWVLYGYLPIDFRWVMKQELRQVPIIGICCEKLGHIFVDRGNHDTALASLECAKQQVVNGTSIIFFPEGTRSRNGQLHSFKKGAFHMACDLNLPVQPVTLIDTNKVMAADSLQVNRHPVSLIIHPIIELPTDGDAPTLLCQQSRQTIASAL